VRRQRKFEVVSSMHLDWGRVMRRFGPFDLSVEGHNALIPLRMRR